MSVGRIFENKLVRTRCASISHTVDNYVIATVYVKLFTTKHHYSIFVETNAVHGFYNFILSEGKKMANESPRFCYSAYVIFTVVLL